MSAYSHKDGEIRIWPYAKAPAALRAMVPHTSEWVAVIPHALVAATELTSLLWRWDDEDHRVVRRDLPDGTLVLAGSYPTMMTMAAAPPDQAASELVTKRRKR